MRRSFSAAVDLRYIFAPSNPVGCLSASSASFTDVGIGLDLYQTSREDRAERMLFRASAKAPGVWPLCDELPPDAPSRQVSIGVRTQSASLSMTFHFAGERVGLGAQGEGRSFTYRAEASALPAPGGPASLDPAVLYAGTHQFDVNGHVAVRGSSSDPLVIRVGGLKLFYAPISDAAAAVALPPPHEHPALSGPPPGPGGAGGEVTDAGGGPGDSGGETAETSGSGGSESGAAGTEIAGGQPAATNTPDSVGGPHDPEIARLIAEWIAAAEPPQNVTEGGDLRYEPWGRFVGGTLTGTITVNQAPDDAGVQLPIEYVWGRRATLDSIDHCKLGEYVSMRLLGMGIEGCAGRYKPKVPDVVGRTRAQATELLEAFDLRPRFVSGPEAPQESLEGTVAALSTPAGETVDRGAAVTATVYGAALAGLTLPDFAGHHRNRVADRLQQMGLTPEFIGGPAAPTREAESTVARQVPEAGARVSPGEVVRITLYSLAARTVAVPNLVGMDAGGAAMAAMRQDLIAYIEEAGPPPAPEQSNRVFSQDPPAGQQVAPGSRIRARRYAKVEIAQVRVPDFVGAGRRH